MLTAIESVGNARTVRQRLRRQQSAHRASKRSLLGRAFDSAVAATVVAALAAGALPGVWHAVGAPAHAVPGAPGRLFAVAVLLLLSAGALGVLRAAGPVSASRAMQFWVLSGPLSLRRLLRPRCVALMAAAVVAFAVIAVPLAHLAATSVAISVVAASLGALVVSAGAIWAQTSDGAEHAVRAAAHSLAATATLAFGSLATGVGRAGANAVLALPMTAGVAVLVIGLVIAGYFVVRAVRGLDRLTPAQLSRGEGLWTSARLSATAMDVALLGEFFADQRARTAGPARSGPLGRGFLRAALRLEWARLRRHPALLVRAAVFAIVWWGCRAVLAGPWVVARAVVGGYLVALPLAATIRELTRRPGLRAQFVPSRRRILVGASLAACATGVTAWFLAIGLGSGVLPLTMWAVVVPVLTIAAGRAASRPDLDYTAPALSTPFGDIPVDLMRQVLRGHLLVAGVLLLLLV